MKYEIEIDLPPDVAAKWVPVAVRKSRRGDRYWDGYGVSTWDWDRESAQLVIILAPRVEWPAWCSADWIAKDADGDIWASIGDRPYWCVDDGEWSVEIDGWRLAKGAHADLYAAFEHVPPELSLIENPKRTKGVE